MCQCQGGGGIDSCSPTFLCKNNHDSDRERERVSRREGETKRRKEGRQKRGRAKDECSLLKSKVCVRKKARAIHLIIVYIWQYMYSVK